MAAPRRRSIEVDGVSHAPAPIPVGSRVGSVVFSSAIPGIDASTGTLPAAPVDQVTHAFRNVRAFLTAAGVTADDVVRMSVLIDDESLRGAINPEWLELFPDARSRPARHTTVQPLRLGMHVQLEVVAVAAD